MAYPSGQKKTGAIGCSIVGESNLDTILRKFVTVCSSNDSISFKSGIGNLTGDIFVGETHNHTILGGIVFVLVLNNKAFPGEVVSFTLTTPPELDLESLEVSFALDYLDERLKDKRIRQYHLHRGFGLYAIVMETMYCTILLISLSTYHFDCRR